MREERETDRKSERRIERQREKERCKKDKEIREKRGTEIEKKFKISSFTLYI